MHKHTKDEQLGSAGFGYRLNVAKVSAHPLSIRLEADDTDRKTLAARWGVASVESLTADLDVRRWKRDGVRVKGVVNAELTQVCVVTLEPVSSTISETFDALFVPEGSRLARFETAEDGAMIVDAAEPDAPETFQDGSIDLGAVCEEFIVLAIDPYPRLPGATLIVEQEQVQDAPEKPSAFSALREWKGKR